MAQQNIYQFINEYDINNGVRASYNSIINIIDNSLYNYINEINHNYNSTNSDTNIFNNINNEIHTDREEPITFTSNPELIGEQCSICWDNVENLETMAVTKCSSKPHVFHKSCISAWTRTSSSCPNCRFHL
jgi:hypothetical protein